MKNESNQFYKTEKEIIDWLNKYNIKNYTLIPDKKYGFVVDINGDVDLSEKNLKYIPIKFNIVSGDFNCSYNQITYLKGCPKNVNKSFYCFNNQLNSLKYCPKEINKRFRCDENKIKSYHFFPEIFNICYLNRKDGWLTFEDAYKIHLKDLIKYEQKLINNKIKKKKLNKKEKINNKI